MAKKMRQIKPLTEILVSSEMEAILMPLGQRVLAAAQQDPDPGYVASLRIGTFRTDRVSVQVGAAPGVGMRVEAKRGTLSRALGAI